MDDDRRERLERAKLSRPHDYFYSAPDHTDTLPDYRRRARETGESIAVSQPWAHNGRAFWKLTDANSGALAWLAFTRPGVRSAKRKVWTLIPNLQEFVTNWYVSVDHELANQSPARELALLVPQPSIEDIKRITRPESVLTLDDIDRHKVTTVLGKATAQAMRTRRLNKQEF